MKTVNFSKVRNLIVFGLLSTSASANTISSVSTSVTEQLMSVVSLLSIISYVAGVAFSMMGLLNFKSHKENPQQIPLSKPVVTLIVAACLLFLPEVLKSSGESLFGENATSASEASNRNLNGI